MPISASDEHEQEAFGPDAIAVLAVAHCASCVWSIAMIPQ